MESNSKNIMEYHGDKDYEPITLWVDPIFRQTRMLFLNIVELIGSLLMVHQDSCHPNRCPHIITPGHLGTGHRRSPMCGRERPLWVS